MKKILWTLAVIAMAALSCTKQENGGETNPVSDGPDDVTYLKINSVTTSELVKSAIKDTRFPTELPASIGLFVVGDGYTDAKYCNIKCVKLAGSDEFNTPLIELKEDKAIVYAYYPYDANIETLDDLKAISVASSVGGDDWMWATPVKEVSTAKPAIDLTFNHALALVEITFNVYGADATMTNVTLAGGDDGTFSKAGTMNATDGKITSDAEQKATKTSPFSQEVSLPLTDGKIVADCLLVPCKTGTDADTRQDFYIKCTYNGKTYSASLTGSEKGVIIRKNTKSTIVLNIKDNNLEVVSVGVSSWGDTNVSGSTATVGGHTVTFNCPEGLKYELYTESVSTALPDEETAADAARTVILRYDKASIPEKRFFFLSEPSGCTFTFDEQSGIITVTDITDNVTVNLGFGTYIHYTAAAKVEPNNKSAFGFPYDEARSTFNGSNGVIAIDGIVTSIGYNAFYNNQQLTGITIPEGVTSIGESAFDTCRKLLDVDFSNCSELTTIGSRAFADAGSNPTYDFQTLNLVLPESLENLGNFAFSNSGLKSLTLPANLKTAGYYAVQMSGKLERLVIEDGAVIGTGMFRGCTSLKTITSNSVTPPSIIQDGEKAFCELLDPSSTLTNIKTVYVPATGVDTYKAADGWSEFSDKIKEIQE